MIRKEANNQCVSLFKRLFSFEGARTRYRPTDNSCKDQFLRFSLPTALRNFKREFNCNLITQNNSELFSRIFLYVKRKKERKGKKKRTRSKRCSVYISVCFYIIYKRNRNVSPRLQIAILSFSLLTTADNAIISIYDRKLIDYEFRIFSRQTYICIYVYQMRAEFVSRYTYNFSIQVPAFA